MTTLTFTSFENGLWQGHLTATTEPRIEVQYQGETLEDVGVSPAEGGWTLTVSIPMRAMSEGVHSFIVVDPDSTHKLADFTMICGAPAADDLRAEVALLRAELDMLKRAVRRMCSDEA